MNSILRITAVAALVLAFSGNALAQNGTAPDGEFTSPDAHEYEPGDLFFGHTGTIASWGVTQTGATQALNRHQWRVKIIDPNGNLMTSNDVLTSVQVVATNAIPQKVGVWGGSITKINGNWAIGSYEVKLESRWRKGPTNQSPWFSWTEIATDTFVIKAGNQNPGEEQGQGGA